MGQELAILIIGSEITDGRLADTNSNYLCKQLRENNFETDAIFTCGDQIPAIIEGLRALFKQSDIVITSGGLGPTSDDLTREAISEYAEQELICNPDVLAQLKEYFRTKNHPFDASNSKQALFPIDSEIIDNPVGTAPGFVSTISCDGRMKKVIALPGIPAELKTMFVQSVLPLLVEQLGAPKPQFQRAFRIFGRGESVINSIVESCNLDTDIEVSYRANFPEVQLILKSRTDEGRLTLEADKVREALGVEHIFSESLDQSLEQVVHDLLCKSNRTLALAESCTGGKIGDLLTSIPGSSQYFMGAVTTYSNKSKAQLLQADPSVMDSEGVVSFATAKMMAEGVRQKLAAQIGISVTGIAGPSGGSKEKPVGTFFVGFSAADKTYAYHYFYCSTRNRIRSHTAYTALNLLRLYLLEYPLQDGIAPR